MESNITRRKYVYTAAMAVLFLAIFIHLFYVATSKKGFFLDDILSFYLANNDVYAMADIQELINEPTEENALAFYAKTNMLGSWYTHDEIMSQYVLEPDERFNYFNTFILQARDVHPPLYYILIRTINSIAPSADFMVVGFLINFIALMLACYLVYRISLLLLDNNLFAIAATAYYGFSCDFINNATTFRMYGLLTLWGLLLMYLYMNWFKADYEFSRKRVLTICLVEFLAMYTQYFAAFYILPMFILTIVLMKKRQVKVGRYIKYSVLTGVIYFIAWPFSLFHVLFSGRGAEVTGNLGSFRLYQVVTGCEYLLVRSLFATSTVYFLAVCGAVAFVSIFTLIQKRKNGSLKSWTKIKHFGIILYLFVTGFCYYGIVGLATPSFSDRYFMASMPMLSIIIVYLLYKFIGLVIHNKNICAGILIVLSLLLCVRWHIKNTPYYLYNSPERLAFIEEYSDLDAVVIDYEDNGAHSEIDLNFMHPNIYKTNNEELATLSDKVSKGNYVLYLSHNIDKDEATKTIEEQGYSLSKLDYSTDFFDIYVMN